MLPFLVYWISNTLSPLAVTMSRHVKMTLKVKHAMRWTTSWKAFMFSTSFFAVMKKYDRYLFVTAYCCMFSAKNGSFLDMITYTVQAKLLKGIDRLEMMQSWNWHIWERLQAFMLPHFKLNTHPVIKVSVWKGQLDIDVICEYLLQSLHSANHCPSLAQNRGWSVICL